MPQDWTPTRMGDICKTNQQTYSVSEKWPFVNYLDTGNITENRVSEIQHLVTGRDALPSRARRKVALGDILYSTVRPNQKHYGIIKEVLPNMLVSTGFAVITTDKTVADSDFLYYYLSQNDIVDSLHAIGEQSVSAYPSIKPSDIEGLELMLPPLPKQVEIGHILRALDDKIANNTKKNHHLASPRLATDSSPDIKRGKSESRKAAIFVDSSRFAIQAVKNGLVRALNSAISLVLGIKHGVCSTIPLLMFCCAEPTA